MNPTKILTSCFLMYFLLIGCFSTKTTTKKANTNPYTTTYQPVGWEKLAQISQKQYLQIIPTDFAIVGESPVIS